MRLSPRLVPGWPKLAWVATFTKGAGTIEVLHGPMVETAEDWCVEAVWAGEFAAGDFDRTDLVFGTGVRCRGDQVVFVSPGHVFDRLWYCLHAGSWYVSNSLAALLACSKIRLLAGYPYYARDIQTIANGLEDYVRSIPTESTSVSIAYYENVVYDGKKMREYPKPALTPPFREFSDYQRFLFETAESIAANYSSPARKHKIVPLASISSGYDSPACAIIARHAGCRMTVSFRQSTSLWRGSDSGESIARHLKMACKTYDTTAKMYPNEEAIWAAEGRAGVVNYTQFDFPEPLCLFFTGWHGDSMWGVDEQRAARPFVRSSTGPLGLCEFRLFRGFFHCVVPFWGIGRADELKALSLSAEMKPWRIRPGHDRPIPRRIIEEAGVPREVFGRRKKNTSHDAPFLWPYSPGAKERFAQYLSTHGVSPPPAPLVTVMRALARVGQSFSDNVLRTLGVHCGLGRGVAPKARSMIFPWANSELEAIYEEALKQVVGKMPAHSHTPPDEPMSPRKRLKPRCVPAWPKLAWVATFAEGSGTIEVLHGPMVETAEDWCAEAVWAGEFAAGDFDRTDLVFGTGIRRRGDRVIFVSSGTLFDRLCYCCHSGYWYVSNSLPALLAVANLDLRPDYPGYTADVQTVTRGLGGYARPIPTQSTDVNVLYFNNLEYSGQGLNEVDKADVAPHFTTFKQYRDFLIDTAKRLGANLRSPARAHGVVPLASISSGYDSTASSFIARYAGCNQTVTITQATSLWRGSDSGEPIARHLGMGCKGYPRTAKEFPDEAAVWAAEGRPGILNWAQYEYPGPVCLFFTGWHGEKVWDRVDHDHPDPFVRRDTGSLGFCEFRLLRGAIQCVVPFWGFRRSAELKAITLSQEMDLWKTFLDYDKPIARRILEDAGVPRGAFAVRKKNTSHEAAFLWPYSPESQASFRCYLRSRGARALSPFAVSFIRCLANFEILLQMNVLGKLGLKRRVRPWRKARSQSLLFQWANAELKERYAASLRSAGITA